MDEDFEVEKNKILDWVDQLLCWVRQAPLPEQSGAEIMEPNSLELVAQAVLRISSTCAQEGQHIIEIIEKLGDSTSRGAVSYSCDQCEQEYSSRKELNQHGKSHKK